MREILFRGKRTDNHQWVEGFYIMDDFENPNPYIVNRWKHRVSHKTIGQYTGLTDKNGKKVFEGDICQIKNHHLIDDTPFVIEWNDGVYNGWVWHDLDESDGMDSFENGVAQNCEVIGNIHDGIERK